MRLLP